MRAAARKPPRACQPSERIRIVKILATLSEIKEVALFYRGARSRTLPVIDEVTPEQERLLEVLNLRRHPDSVGHTEQSL
jgi:hypothetical protein